MTEEKGVIGDSYILSNQEYRTLIKHYLSIRRDAISQVKMAEEGLRSLGVNLSAPAIMPREERRRHQRLTGDGE